MFSSPSSDRAVAKNEFGILLGQNLKTLCSLHETQAHSTPPHRSTSCQVPLLKHSLERRREGKRRHELVEVDVVKIAGGAVRINPVGVVLKPNLHHFMSHIQLSRHGSVTSIDCSAARIRAATLHSHLLALLLLALLHLLCQPADENFICRDRCARMSLGVWRHYH